MKKNIRKLSYFILSLFVVLGVYIGYISVFAGPFLATNPYNRRLAAMEEEIPRGTIFDRNGEILAATKGGTRTYPLGKNAAHVVGFVSQRYGRTGLERAYDQYLLGMSGEDALEVFIDRLLGRSRVGNDVVTTLDASLQRLAMDLLGVRKGAVVALDPRTGDILALASSPSFNPNNIDRPAARLPEGETLNRYDLLTRDEDSPLLNRATQGAYPPGSIFKLVTGAGVLTDNPPAAEQVIDCRGSLTVDGFRLTDIAAHGTVDFNKAVAVSCNTFFARMGLELGSEKLYKTAEAFGVTKNPWMGNLPEVACRPGTLTPPKKMNDVQLASTAIGQGELLVSPLHMALVTAAIANDGVIMRPHLLDRVQRPQGGQVILQHDPEPWLTPVSREVAQKIKEAMVEAVKWGTARSAALPGITVAGKTGSAQNPHGRPHAWFVGFAPAEEPRVAVAVIIENGGYGGAAAAPVAREIMKQALKGTL